MGLSFAMNHPMTSSFTASDSYTGRNDKPLLGWLSYVTRWLRTKKRVLLSSASDNDLTAVTVITRLSNCKTDKYTLYDV